MTKRPHPSSRDSRRGSSSSGSHAGSESSSHSRKQSSAAFRKSPRNDRELPPLAEVHPTSPCTQTCEMLTATTQAIPELHTRAPSSRHQRGGRTDDVKSPIRDLVEGSTSTGSRVNGAQPNRKHHRADTDGARSATLAIHSGPPSRYNASTNSSPSTVAGSNGRLTPATSSGGSRSVNGQTKTPEASSRPYPHPEERSDLRQTHAYRTTETLPSLPSVFGQRQLPPQTSPYLDRSREHYQQYSSPIRDQYATPSFGAPVAPYHINAQQQYRQGPPPPRPGGPTHGMQPQHNLQEPPYPLPPLQPQYPTHPAYGHPHDAVNSHMGYPPGVMVAYNNFENIGMDESGGRRRRGNLPKGATTLFRNWLQAHISNPYPTEDEKQWMQDQTGMSASQVRLTPSPHFIFQDRDLFFLTSRVSHASLLHFPLSSIKRPTDLT